MKQNDRAVHPPSQSGASQMVNVLLEMERPSVEELAPYPRGERYRLLRANSEAQRARLEDWLEDHHLDQEVKAISPATGFNLLFVTCTPHAADELARAPGVLEVMLTDRTSLTLQHYQRVDYGRIHLSDA